MSHNWSTMNDFITQCLKMDVKKKRPSRVQGAWGGGGAQQPRRGGGGTIGQRRLGEKLGDSKNSQFPSGGSSSGRTQSSSSAGHLDANAGVGGLSTTSSKNFVFQQPTDDELFRKPPEEMAIQDEGMHEISLGPTAPARLRFFPQLFEKKEANWIFDDLLKQLPWRQQVNKKEGRDEFMEPRLTAWFGDFPYRYSGVVQHPNPWSPIMTMLKDRVEQLTEHKFNSCLANLYRNDKDSIGWHADDEPLLGKCPVIASLSFGDVRVFELRKKPEPPYERDDYRFSQIIKVPLPHGSLLVMEGATQEDWQHRVPKEYHDRESRVNLTFRTIYPELETRRIDDDNDFV